MGKIARIIKHIRKGTLLDRVHGQWRERIKKRRQIRWESQSGKREYLEARIEHGIRMRLHFDSQLARIIYCDGFETGERHFINAFLRSGDVFVDVGANIGLFSVIAANRVGNSGMVYAFEPARKTFHRLHENMKLNNFCNVQCFQLALSDESGEFPFYTSEDGFDAWNSIVHPIAGKSFSREFIQCVTWDHYARLHDLLGKVTMMKIDVEGWETRVLGGGHEALSRGDAPLLQIEFTEEAAASAGSSCKDLYHMLEGFGYCMFRYDLRTRTLVPDPLREKYPYVNLIAAKKLEEVSLRLRKRSFWR
jgi:FkbM family methyltransferase